MRALLTALVVVGVCSGVPRSFAQESQVTASSALYIRNDSDGTTVITPRLSVGAPINEATRVDAVYTVDVWTSASVDIRSSASKAVTEQRDEIDLSVEHAFTDITLGGSYRYSTEYDYESHGGTFGGSYDFADNNANIALSARAFFDQVGRAGDPGFKKAANTLGARAAFTQVYSRVMLGQFVYEYGLQTGYLSSPYRYVRFTSDTDPTIGTCSYPVGMCAPEENPDSRMRHAFSYNHRWALAESLSIGGSLRFYFDDWAVMSGTLGMDGTWTPAERWLVSAGYRLYTQSEASHYRPSYPLMSAPTQFTRDKELSSLTSHRLNVEVTRTWALDDAGAELNLVLLVAPAYFGYSNFPLLDHITAIEATLAMEVRL